jgi:hypothetical protein
MSFDARTDDPGYATAIMVFEREGQAVVRNDTDIHMVRAAWSGALAVMAAAATIKLSSEGAEAFIPLPIEGVGDVPRYYFSIQTLVSSAFASTYLWKAHQARDRN